MTCVDLTCPDTAQVFLSRIHSSFAQDARPAYRTDTGDLTFAALHDASAALTEKLRAVPNAQDRAPVLIWGHKDLRYPVAYWACLLSGRALVPVEPETPRERMRQIAQTCGASTVLVASGSEDDITHVTATFRDSELTVLTVDTEARPTGPVPVAVPDPRDVAYIMFSSGTLGQPKGIQVTYANLIDFVGWLDNLLPEPAMQAVSGNIRHCFDVSLFELWTSWTRKLPITALDHANFAVSTFYVQRLQKDGVGLWVSTPSITRLLLKNHRFNGEFLTNLRTFVFCGEPLTKPIVTELFKRFPGCRVVNTYGPTECTVAVTSVDITPEHLEAHGDLPIGYTRAGTRLFARDGGDTGEIMIAGDSVGKGYLNLPEKQSRAFPEPQLYRSGDWGRVDADGLWHFRGRMDREVKVQGVRIDLNDVEAHIRRQPGVEDVVVDTYMLRGEPRALDAYVIGAASEADLAQIARTLEAELPSYLVPRFWYAGFAMILNNNSKLDRSRLAEASKVAGFRYVHAQTRATA
ncbi:AMP-binding protein [Thalassococcus sp. S3]|uniref:AMP-binding protein n=1 Tax=Thalassococcus sp. S3 TaxID=2017482 RepID=UPI0010241309|nr:AMP-binding protein [Thalassococcus sp. S3]QBF29670.1 D-alanine--poly(phosphoribitol) ligase [Thalassococcus sp. S3]